MIDWGLAWVAANEVPVYRIGHLVGVLVAVGTFLLLARREGLALGRVLALTAAVVAAVWVGARGLHLVLTPELYRAEPERLLRLRFGGFALYGGLLVGALVGWAVARGLRLPVWRLADPALIAGGLGLACLRCGCFGHGCCFGQPTDLPWGVTYPPGRPAWLANLSGPIPGLGPADATAPPVHPTQLYELLAALAAVGLVLALRRRGLPAGVPALLGAALFAAGRGLIWQLRAGPSPLPTTGWVPVVIYGGGALVLIAAARWRWQRAVRLGGDVVGVASTAPAEPARFP